MDLSTTSVVVVIGKALSLNCFVDPSDIGELLGVVTVVVLMNLAP